MSCEHEAHEMESAAISDGLCPLCMDAEIERLKKALRMKDMVIAEEVTVRVSYEAEIERLKKGIKWRNDRLAEYNRERDEARKDTARLDWLEGYMGCRLSVKKRPAYWYTDSIVMSDGEPDFRRDIDAASGGSDREDTQGEGGR